MSKPVRPRDYGTIVSRRALIFGSVQGVVFGGLLARLGYLQAIEGRQYSRLSYDNKYNFRIVSPSRGRIFDSDGRLLADNAETYQLSIIPDYVDDIEKTLRVLAHLVRLDDETIRQVIRQAESGPSFIPVQISASLTQREVARLVVRNPEFPGVIYEKAEKRVYPQGALAAHLTGYVNRVTQSELDAGEITPELASLRTGKSGVERAFERALRGAPGRQRVTVNAFGRPVDTDVHEQSENGSDIRLSINVGLQSVALAALKQAGNEAIPRTDRRVARAIDRDPELARLLPESEEFAYINSAGRVTGPEVGSAVVIDVKTGAVNCLVSTPGYDPNLFAGRLTQEEWQTLSGHPHRPLLNRALSGQYAPGSVFKMAVALAALEAGVIDTNTRFTCPGHKEVGDVRFHCWLKNGHGRVNVTQAIERSCDVFFYELGIRAGIRRVANMAKRLGLGEMTGIGLPGEKPGLVPTPQWKAEKIGGNWSHGETVNVAIGQGYVLTTPLQLAVMTARLASGVKKVTPRVTAGDSLDFEPLGIDPAALKIVTNGMRRVMSGGLGTARRHDLANVKSGMAGKTGTVQVRSITPAERERGITDNVDRQWKWRDHAVFTGYAPYEDPRYAVAVVVEHGGGGSSAAAPVARRVLSWLLEEKA